MGGVFYEDYDRLIRLACPGYDYCLDLMVENILDGTGSILDLGSGTGTLAAAILKKRPNIRVYGLEAQQGLVDVANKKLGSAVVVQGDILDFNWPRADGVTSSLVIHHFSHQDKERTFRHIFNNSRFFLYFDIFRGNSKRQERLNKEYVFNYMRRNGLSEDMVAYAKKSMEEHDNPLSVREQERMFRKIGFTYKLLHMDHGLGVYLCMRNE